MHALASPHPPPPVRPPPPAAPADTDRAVLRWVWHSRFGTIVIEVRGDDVFVDGDRVAPHVP